MADFPESNRERFAFAGTALALIALIIMLGRFIDVRGAVAVVGGSFWSDLAFYGQSTNNAAVILLAAAALLTTAGTDTRMSRAARAIVVFCGTTVAVLATYGFVWFLGTSTDVITSSFATLVASLCNLLASALLATGSVVVLLGATRSRSTTG